MSYRLGEKDLIIGGLLLATGIILPMALHSFGTGAVFLPMHIPVLIGGLILPPPIAFLLGALTPILSSAFTGMPLLFPVATIMVFELGAYGFFASLAVRVFKLKLIPSLLLAMIIGRLTAGLVLAILTKLFGVKLSPALYIIGSIATGLPGILIQLLIVPTLVKIIRKQNQF